MYFKPLLAATVLLSLGLAATPVASAEQPVDCPDWASFESALLGASVTVNADCTVDVVLFKNINCVGPWIGKHEQQLGPVHITTYYCQGPGGDPT